MSNETPVLFRSEALAHQRNRLLGEVVLLPPLSLRLLSAAALLVSVGLLAAVAWGTYARKETLRGYLAPDHGLAKVIPSPP